MAAKEFELFYRTIIEGFMLHDIQVAIEGKANFFSALCPLSYSEVLGRLMLGRFDGRSRAGETAFYEFTKLMPPSYQNLPTKDPSTYAYIRDNLVHQYGLNIRGTIHMSATPPNGCGIEMDTSERPYKVHMFVQQFLEDFKRAAQSYHDQVVNNPSGQWAQNFQKLLPKLDKKAWHP